jgi:DNA-binding transcriptional ArsR family regulator
MISAQQRTLGSGQSIAKAHSMQDSLRSFKAGIFRALVHPTRIAIVELLRDDGEVAVSMVYERLGLEQANVSQLLAVLRARHIVAARKEGTQVFYSLRDRIIEKVLDLMRKYFHAHLEESLAMLQDMPTEKHRRPRALPAHKKE